MLELIGFIPPLLFAVVLHEVAHGWAAEKLGDPTARKLGRITLNPIKHIDPFLTIIVPGLLIASNAPFIFGGAKPVPVDPRHFTNPRKHMAYVAVAGPIINFILAALCYLGFHLLGAIFPLLPLPDIVIAIFVFWMIQGVIINLVLGLFNLIPIPPLDGGRIAVGFLPLKMARYWSRLEPYGILIVVALLFSGVLDTFLSPILDFASKHLISF
jgi:Zn-dependent protease